MRLIIDRLNREIITTVAESGSVTVFTNAAYGVIQGDDEFIMLVSVALGLDISQIPNFTMTTDEKKVYKDQAFGRKKINNFLSQNPITPIITSTDATQLQNFMTLKTLMDAGQIVAARDVLVLASGPDLFGAIAAPQSGTRA